MNIVIIVIIPLVIIVIIIILGIIGSIILQKRSTSENLSKEDGANSSGIEMYKAHERNGDEEEKENLDEHTDGKLDDKVDVRNGVEKEKATHDVVDKDNSEKGSTTCINDADSQQGAIADLDEMGLGNSDQREANVEHEDSDDKDSAELPGAIKCKESYGPDMQEIKLTVEGNNEQETNDAGHEEGNDVKSEHESLSDSMNTEEGKMNEISTSDQGSIADGAGHEEGCLLYTSPSPRDATLSRMPSSA